MTILKKLNIKREIIEVSIRMLGHTWQDNGSNSIPTCTQHDANSHVELNYLRMVAHEKLMKYDSNGNGPGGGGGVLRFGSDGGVPLKPPNPYLSLRVILAEKGTYY